MRGSERFKIVVAEPFAPEAIARLQEVGEVSVLEDSAPATLVAALVDADALLVRSKAHVTARIIEAAPRLKVIGRASPTPDHIDLKAAGRRQISVVYAPHVAVTATAEFALALILALHRRIFTLDRQLRDGQFESLRAPTGRDMSRITLGLLGMDPVAEHLGTICKAAFGMPVIYHDPGGLRPTALQAQVVELDDLLTRADILSLHLSGTGNTKGILSAQRIALLKPTTTVVNTSRGSLIDTIALAQALKSGRIAGAALDVFEVEPLPTDHPLRRSPNTILTPHVAGATLDATGERFRVCDDVVRVLQGLEPLHAVAPTPAS